MPRTLKFPSDSYQVWQHNWDFHNACRNKRCVWFCGGIGSGKSVAGAVESYWQAADVCPGGTGLIVVPDYSSFEDITRPLLNRFWPDAGWDIRTSRSAGRIIEVMSKKGTLSTIYVRSASDNRNVERIQGLTIDWAWIDEPSRMKVGQKAFNYTLGRMRGTSGEKRTLFVTGSPRGFNWLATAWGIKEELPPHAWQSGVDTQPDYYVRAARTAWNTENPPDYLESLIEAYGEEYARQELQGAIISSEGRIYPTFYKSVHTIDHAKAMRLFSHTHNRSGGADFGWTNPAALVWGGWDSNGWKTYIGEWYHKRKTGEEQGVAALTASQNYGITKWCCDTENPETINKWRYGFELNGKRYKVPGVKDAIKRWQPGVDAVRIQLGIHGVGKLDHPGHPPGNKLGRPGLLLSEKMVNTIEEFQSYREIEIDPDKPPREGAVGECHALDSVRYDVIDYHLKYRPKDVHEPRL